MLPFVTDLGLHTVASFVPALHALHLRDCTHPLDFLLVLLQKLFMQQHYCLSGQQHLFEGLRYYELFTLDLA